MAARYHYVLDSSAWSAFFGGSPAGLRVEEILSLHEVATSVLTVAELSDVYARSPPPLPDQFDEARAFVETASDILPLTPQVAAAAGPTKLQLRSRVRRIGLVDALILETARSVKAKLLTTDADFRGVKGVELLVR